MTVNLHALTAQTVRDNPEVADPGAMADLVFSQIGPEDYAAVIKTMIRDYTRQVMSGRRHVRVPSHADVGGIPGRGKSAFVAAMQSGAWKERLKDAYHTSTGWKLLGEMTTDDLAYAAGERRALAQANIIAAEHLDTLGKLLGEHGAETVGALADDVLQQVLA